MPLQLYIFIYIYIYITQKRGEGFLRKIAFYVLKIFKFLPRLFGHVEKRLGQKDQVSF